MNSLLISSIGLAVLIVLGSVLFNSERLAALAEPSPRLRWPGRSLYLLFAVAVAEACFAIACLLLGIELVYSLYALAAAVAAFACLVLVRRARRGAA